MTPQERIEEKTGNPFFQNHPILDALDYGDVRDLMEEYARELAIDLLVKERMRWINEVENIMSVQAVSSGKEEVRKDIIKEYFTQQLSI
ncbi:MAG: hypothetical protein WC389_08930 [Lutibacter sp.]|jgi:hypothetical protein